MGALSAAERSYPTSEVKGGRPRRDTKRPRSGVAAGRRYPMSLSPRSGAAGRRRNPTVAAQAQEGLEELSHLEDQKGWR